MGLLTATSVRWELARFHTRESWLQWFAALWGACLAASFAGSHIDLLFVARILGGNILCMTLVHGAACTWNDIIDRHIDALVQRTKGRPLPTGRISVPGAFVSYLFLLSISVVSLYLFFGPIPTKLALINEAIYVVYPFAKKHIRWPQLVLAPAVGWPAFVGWTSVTGSTDSLSKCVPLCLAVSVWTIYFDTAYGFQDAQDDKKIGVNSLAVWIGDNIHFYLDFLGVVIIGLLSLSAYTSGASFIFWTFGIGVWALNIPLHIRTLKLDDRSSGGQVFRQNISLGGYISLVSVAELLWRAFH